MSKFNKSIFCTLLALAGSNVYADPAVDQNVFVSAFINPSRQYIELNVQNLNDDAIQCKFISVKAKYVDTQSGLDLGFRSVLLENTEIAANSSIFEPEGGREIIMALRLNYPAAQISSLNESDIRYSCKLAKPPVPNPEPGVQKLAWDQISATDIRLKAGESLPTLTFKAKGRGTITYRHGHPEDECSWDRPKQIGDAMTINGTVPHEGVYTLNSKTLLTGQNQCNIRLLGSNGSEEIALDLKVTITKDDNEAMKWINVPSTSIIVSAGSPLPPLRFTASSDTHVSYSHGHPVDECSWDIPKDKGGYLEFTGTAPASGRYTLSGKILQPGNNICRIQVVATDSHSNTITRDLTVTIIVPQQTNAPKS